MVKHIRIALVSIASIMLFSCAAPKVVTPVKEAELDEVLNGLASCELDYTWFAARARVKFQNSDSRMGGRCNIRMIKDSLIWMNFKKLSIEASRILLTKDSFWIKYPLDKMYEAGPLQELMDYYELKLNFGELQDLIAGNFVVPEAKMVDQFETKSHHEISFQDLLIDYKYQIDGKYQVRKFSISDHLNRKIIGGYDDYDQRHIARLKEFAVSDESGIAKVSFKFSDIEIDVEKSIVFEIPEHYYKLP